MLLSSQSGPPVYLLASPLNFQDLGHLFSHYSEIVFRKTSYLLFFCLFCCVFIMYLHRLHNSIPFHLVYFFFNFIFKFYNILLVLPNTKFFHHRYTWFQHPEPSSLLPPHTIPLGHPNAPAPSIQYRASNLDWRLVPYTILYVFQCHSPISSHPLPLPQSPKDGSIHQCLFCCLIYRVMVAIFLNSIYMR